MGEEAAASAGPCWRQTPGECPFHSVDVDWREWSISHLAWPVGVQCALSAIFLLLLEPAHRCGRQRQPTCLRRWFKRYVGTQDVPVLHPGGLIAVFTAEMVASIATVIVWIMHTYNHSVSVITRTMLFGTASVNLLNWVICRLRAEMQMLSLWEADSIVDALTLVPMLHFAWRVQSGTAVSTSSTDWLSLNFLRAYSVWCSFQRLQNHFQRLHKTSAMWQMFIALVLRAACVIVMMAGTIFTCEVLGDPEEVGESFGFVETPAGDKISFLQMVYWIVCSITTVGYGDFAPRTVLSRILTMAFILIGVVYIFNEQYNFSQAWSQLQEGSGTYRLKKGSSHVVVFLCTRRDASPFSPMVAAFLREVLHPDVDRGDRPDVVVFSQRMWEEGHDGGGSAATFADFLREEGFSGDDRRRVTFIVGKFTSKVDLDRGGVGTSFITFLLSDPNSGEPDKDDEDNIFTAVMLRMHYPGIRLRLMLLRPEAKELAVQAGIENVRCFSLRQLKANILAQNVRCHGLVPMVTGLLKTVDPQDDGRGGGAHAPGSHNGDDADHDHGKSPDDGGDGGRVDVFKEYLQGLQHDVYGFEVSEEYASGNFRDLVQRVFKDTGAIVFAACVGGTVVLAPQEVSSVHTGQVCFAIAFSEKDLVPVSMPNTERGHWRKTFLNARGQQLKRVRREGPHVAAAQIMGSTLQPVLLHAEPPVPRLNAKRFGSTGIRPSNRDGRDTAQSSRRPSLDRCTEAESQVGDISCDVSQELMFQGLSAGNSDTPMEVIARTQRKRVRELRMNIEDFEELVVLIVCKGEVWQQAHTFVSALRAKYIPEASPIVIFAPSQPPPLMFDDCGDRVLVVEGMCTKAKMLVEAGVLEARAVVVMTGEQSVAEQGKDAIYQDARTVLCAQVLECWCGISKHEIYTTYEMQESISVKNLPDMMAKPAVTLDRFLSEQAFMEEDDASDEDEAVEVESVGIGESAHIIQDLCKTWGGRSSTHSDGHLDGEHAGTLRTMSLGTTALFHPRFAAGQIFTPELWGAMLGKMVYMPAIIELVEALVMPHRRGQHSFPWQFRVPDHFLGRPYEELFLAISSGKDFMRASQGTSTSEEGNRVSPDHRTDRGLRTGVAVALALYRKKDHGDSNIWAPGTGGGNYTILAPSPVTRLRKGDWVLALGSRKFGRAVHRNGLLRGGQPRPSSNASAAFYHPAMNLDFPMQKMASTASFRLDELGPESEV